MCSIYLYFFFFQAEDGIRDYKVTGVQTCALPITSPVFSSCTGVVKDEKTGEVLEIHCTYDPATRGGNAPDGRKVKSTIHWVSAAHAIDAEVRLYDNLFTREDPNQTDEGENFTANLNPRSLEILTCAKLEPSLRDAAEGSRY